MTPVKTISAFCPHNVFLMNIMGPAPDDPEEVGAWLNKHCSYEVVAELQKSRCPKCRQLAEKLDQLTMPIENLQPVTNNLNLVGKNLNTV
jgi:hypothetical protein